MFARLGSAVLAAAIVLCSANVLSQAPVGGGATIDRTSASYLDFSTRLRASVADNSIALLMIADSLRNGEATSENIVGILTDHKNRISGLDSFRAGRHSVTLKGGARGELSSSGLIEKFTGAGASVGAGLDFEIVRHSRDLIPLSGREQAQTGYDYVIGDAQLIPKACGSLTGGVKAPAMRVADAKIEATGTLCYEYTPSSMTALGGYIAQNQDRLARLEKLGGEDLAFLTDRLFQFLSGTCGAAECEAMKRHLGDLEDAGLGLDLPRSVRSEDEVRAEALTDPSIAVLLDDNAATREHIVELETSIGRKLSQIEKALIGLSANDGKILSSLSDLQKEQLRQGKLLEVLADPEVQAEMMINAMAEAEKRLRAQQEAMTRYLVDSSYEDLSEDQKRAKFALEVDKIEDDYQTIGTYTAAAQNTLLLIGALTGASPETQRDIQKAFAVINAANEMVKAGRTIRNAADAGMLASTTAVGAYASGVGAVLMMVSLFSSSGGDSEMQGLANYIGARFDVVDEKLNLLIDQSVSLHQKVDALLEGQRVITDIVIKNARAIQADRIEQAVIAESIESVGREIRALGLSVDEGFTAASVERSVFFDAELRRDQEAAITAAEAELDAWLNPDSDVIERLNAGERSAQLMDAVRAGRQKVLVLIDQLSGPVFIRSLEVIAVQDNNIERPPVHGLAALPDKAREVADLTAFYRDFRTPVATISSIDPDEARKDDETLAAMQERAFPPINASAFTNLANPDALLPVLEGYLTFVLALTPEAREDIGFSDLPRIVALIERLSASKREAQAATFALFAASRDSLTVMNRDLEALSSQQGLFARRDSLDQYLFAPESLKADSLDDAEADAFVERAKANPAALDWVSSNAAPYIERGLQSDTSALLGLVAYIKETGGWRLPERHSSLAMLHDSRDGPWWNLRLLTDLNALLNAHDAGELEEYSDEEIDTFDEIVGKPVLSDTDIANLVGLIKSPKALIELADDEQLIHFSVTTENEAFDLDPTTADLARLYGTVKHTIYHSGNQSSSYDGFVGIGDESYSVDYACKGAEIRIEPGMEGVYKGPTYFAFPTDDGVAAVWGELARLAANAVVDCAMVAQAKDLKVPHPEPYGKYTGSDYWAITRDTRFSPESFKRDAVMVADGTKLFERATSRCAQTAEWNAELVGTPGVNIAAPIATLAWFVERTLDSPFGFESQKIVDEKTKELFSADNQPLDPRRVECTLLGESASQTIAPEFPQLKKPRPAELTGASWHFAPGGKIMIAPGFRTGVIAALQARRSALSKERLEAIGDEFREPTSGLNSILREMNLAGVPDEKRKELIAAYQAGRRRAFLTHPVFTNFVRTHAEVAEEALRRDHFYLQRQNQIGLLQTFAEWGLGECLFTVPEYATLAMLLWEPVVAHMTVPDAIRVLQDPKAETQYPFAAAALKEGQSRLEARIAELTDFPPEPEQGSRIYYDRRVDSAIDTATALAIAGQSGCRPGHDTIIALEGLAALISDEGLVPSVPTGN
jgi:hypothetical protein